MAKSRLHELAERGQSVWIDLLSREFVHGGRAAAHDRRGRRHRAHLEPVDLPEGDREGARLRRADRRRCSPRATTRPRSSSRSRSTTCATRATCCGRSGTRPDGQDGYVSLEVDPALAYDTDETLEQAIELHERGRRGRTSTSRSRPRSRACRRSRTRIARGVSINITLIFSLERYRGRRRGLHARARAARRRRRRSVEGRVGRVVLRLAHRHRGRQAARGARQHRAAGQARRSRTRSSPTSTSRRRSPGRAGSALAAKGAPCSGRSGRRPRPRTRPTATCIYVEELIGPDTVNTMPPETVTAFQDHGEVRGDTVLEGVDEAERLLDRAARGRASTTTTSCETLEVEGVRSSSDAFDELIAGIRAKQGELARDLTTERRELVERIWSRDPTVWTGAGRGPLARLARRAVRAGARTSTCC